MTARAVGIVTLLLAASAAFAGCDGDRRAPRVATDGDPARGRQAIARHGCGGCHQVPGVRSARGIVGPSLAGFAARPYVAGRLPNDAANLVAWIRRPRDVDPQTIMPDLGVPESDARDIAAFLSTAR